MLNKIFGTEEFTGKQPQTFWRGTWQRPILLSSKMLQATQHYCHRGADSKALIGI